MISPPAASLPFTAETVDGSDTALDFHERSSIDSWRIARRRVPVPWNAPADVRDVVFKAYPRFSTVPLPPPGPPPELSLAEALRCRRSGREPSPEPLDGQLLSTLLHWSVGHHEHGSAGEKTVRRHYPSAGARFPVELYLAAMRCRGAPEGVYHVATPPRVLERLRSPDRLPDEITRIFGYDWIRHARAVLLLTAMIDRTAVKYGSRGYRYALLEAGHAAQNICLVATALGVGTAPVGGFADCGVMRLIGPTTRRELPLYAVVFP